MTGRRFQERRSATSVATVGATAAAIVPGVTPAPARGAGAGLRRMQQTHGNQAVQALLGGTVQAKAATGRPGDRWEAEADRIARRVAGFATGLDDLRARTESATGADLSGARLHTGAGADALNRAAGSLALTRGRDVHFRDGQFRPGTSAGRHLIAHELTHVAQQAAGAAPATQHAKFGLVRNPFKGGTGNRNAATLGGRKIIAGVVHYLPTEKIKRSQLEALSIPGAVEADLNLGEKSRVLRMVQYWSHNVHEYKEEAASMVLSLRSATSPNLRHDPEAVLAAWERVRGSARRALNGQNLGAVQAVDEAAAAAHRVKHTPDASEKDWMLMAAVWRDAGRKINELRG